MDIQTEISLMDQRLSTMENKLDDVESKLDSMDKKLNQVIEALIGNPLTKSNGLVEDVKSMKDKVDDHDQSLKKVKWFWLGVISVGSALAVLIQFIFKVFG